MILGGLTFLTPFGGLLAVAVLLPLVAFAVSASKSARGRAMLRLAPPSPDHHTALVALAAVPLLLGLAAAEPALRVHAGHHIRTDTQAIFVLDTSRSMAASAGRGSPTRLSRAQEAAVRLRAAIPDVPSGIASLTTQLLPHLFPTADPAVFNATVHEAIGVEKPPPPVLQVGLPGTSFWPLIALRDQGYFAPTAKRRFAILLTDGESGPFPIQSLVQAFRQTVAPPQFPGAPPQRPQAPITLLIVRIGGANDRIYLANGSIENAYRPNADAVAQVRDLAAATQGQAFAAADLPAAESALRNLVESGHAATSGSERKTIDLAPYIVLVAFAPLALIIRRRNLTEL